MSSKSLEVRYVPTKAIYTDKGTGATNSVAIYEPIFPDDSWGFFGHIAIQLPPGVYSTDDAYLASIAPLGLVVKASDGTVNLLSQAVKDELIYTDQHSGGSQNLEIYSFKAVNSWGNLIPIGLFANTPNSYGDDPTNNSAWNKLRVVDPSLLMNQHSLPPEKIWDDSKSGAHGNGKWEDITLWRMPLCPGCVTNPSFFASEGYGINPDTFNPGQYGLDITKVNVTGTYCRWMEDNSNDLHWKMLKNICLPATHDSGTYALQNLLVVDYADDDQFKGILYEKVFDKMKEVADVIHKFPGVGWLFSHNPFNWVADTVFETIHGISTAQHRPVFQQLVEGIRCLDLRVYKYNDEFYAGHGLLGPTIRSILNDVKHFLDITSGEIVFITLGHWTRFKSGDAGNAEYLKLRDMIRNIFTDDDVFKCDQPGMDCFSVAYEDIIGNNPRSKVIFTWDMQAQPASFKQDPYFFPITFSPPSGGIGSSTDVSQLTPPGVYGYYTDTEDISAMVTQQTAQLAVAQDNGYAFALYMTMTPSETSTIERVMFKISTAINLLTNPLLLIPFVGIILKLLVAAVTLVLTIVNATFKWYSLFDLYNYQGFFGNFDTLLGQGFGQGIGSSNSISIVYTDFYHKTNVVDQAIALNKQSQTFTNVFITESISSAEGVTLVGYDFFTKTVDIYYTSGKMVLSSTPDGRGQVKVDDSIKIENTRIQEPKYCTTNRDNQIVPFDPIDITSMFVQGNNRLTLTFHNDWGPYSCSRIYIVKI